MTESEEMLSPADHDDETDLRELFRGLWAGKWLIGGITFAAAAIANTNELSTHHSPSPYI